MQLRLKGLGLSHHTAAVTAWKPSWEPAVNMALAPQGLEEVAGLLQLCWVDSSGQPLRVHLPAALF